MLKTLCRVGIASITEVVMAATIFVLAAAGVLAAVSFLRPQGADSARRLQAAYVGKGVVDRLRSEVTADTWTSGNFSSGVTHVWTEGEYIINYTLEDVPAGCDPQVDCAAKKLTMDVTYPE